MPYHQGLLPQRRQPDDLGGLLDPMDPLVGLPGPRDPSSFSAALGQDIGTIGRGLLNFIGPTSQIPGQILFEGRQPSMQDVMAVSALSAGGGLLFGRAPTGALGANVWHGGPNRWMPEPGFPQGRPLLSRVGTGEGRTHPKLIGEYGHGFYASGQKGVARDYQPTREKLFNKQPPNWDDPRVFAADVLKNYGGNRKAALKELSKFSTMGATANIRRVAIEGREVLKRGDKLPVITYAEKGFLKKLDLPDEDIAKMLDWDAPLSRQSKDIQAKLKKMWVEAGGDPKSKNPWGTGANSTGDSMYTNMASHYGSREAASEALRKAGIPGLKFKETPGRRPRNYVVWDQDVLNRTKILESGGKTVGLLKKPRK